jgi:GT2 family glycosyltransferase
MDVRVLIGVPMGEHGRYNQFHKHLRSIIVPPNAQTCIVVGRSAAENRNIIIKDAIEQDFTHVLFIDDDMVPEPGILYKLIQHERSIVSGLYFTRSYPHQPVAFSKFDDFNNIEWYTLENDKTGLVQVDAVGLGACLIHTRVFKDMDYPWIRYGEIGKPDSWCHDIGFFRRAKKRGFPTWLDLDCHVGHIGETVVRPRQADGKWYYAYSTDGINEIFIPQPEIKVMV